uniref:Replicative DNA helicase n=1 Tax=Plagiogrammopsis vanheurckii TaxID=1234821 RepID=A0A2U9NN54_9STRA|nr:DNA replication helicase [Plagiogrammopsis vanheurckii]AWT38532.1 DNA replication helicase [Plagiogrammopsis vanheurckii]
MSSFPPNTNRLIIERYLPHNFLAEKTILSSLLINSEAIDICLRTITIETFYFKNHQEIYKAILSMYRKKVPIDIITLNTFLQDNGLLEKIGGIKVLIDLVNQVPNLVYLEDYIRLIQDKFIRRSLIKFGYEAINSGYITNLSLEDILSTLETQLFNLTNEVKSQNISSSVDLFSSVFLELKEKSLQPSLAGLSSGFYDLDSFTQGFQKSDLIIVAGRPSMGKTALCLNIAINIVKTSQLPVLFFSLEMSKKQLTYRLLATETLINPIRLRNGNLYKEDWLRLNTTIKDLSSLPLFIDDTPNLSIQDIRSKIKKIIFEHNHIGLIVIDYLQLMQNSKLKIENRVQELSQITRSLKNLAREFNVPLIALSQLSRNVESRMMKRPILSDLRDSGSIEQDADLVLMLYRESYYNFHNEDDSSIDNTELIITKQRNGPIGTVELKFDTIHTRFLNLISDV